MDREKIKEMSIPEIAEFKVKFDEKYKETYGDYPKYSIENYCELFGISYGEMCGVIIYLFNIR